METRKIVLSFLFFAVIGISLGYFFYKRNQEPKVVFQDTSLKIQENILINNKNVIDSLTKELLRDTSSNLSKTLDSLINNHFKTQPFQKHKKK